MMQYFEFSEDNVSCFLEITLENRIVRTRYGQNGTQGIVKEKVFGDDDTAAQEYEKLVDEKKKDDTFYFKLDDSFRL